MCWGCGIAEPRPAAAPIARRRWEELMNLLRRSFLRLAAAAVALPAVSQAVWAQAYPARPITMIVPASGGGQGVLARPDRRDRKRERRRRIDRRRPRRARGAGRLYDRHRPLDALCLEWCDLQPPLRLAEGLRAGRDDRDGSARDRRQKDFAGKRSERACRLAEGQSREGACGHRWRRYAAPCR